MSDVPRDLTNMGLAGLIPYVFTSVTSLFMAWDVNYGATTGSSPYLFSRETAQNLLDILEPVQVGYGAVILSFLGAVRLPFPFFLLGARELVALGSDQCSAEQC